MTFLQDSMVGLFLMFIALCGTFINSATNCSLQRYLKKYPYVIWIVVFFVIYSSINFTSKEDSHPNYVFLNSLFIFGLFVLFMKQSQTTFLLILLLLVAVFTLNRWFKYLKKKNRTKHLKSIQTIIQILQYSILGVLVLGTVLYYRQQKGEYKQRFSWFLFFFGTKPCRTISS